MQGVAYPWEKWFNKSKPFILKEGVHYDGMTHGMVVLTRLNAKKYGVTVSVHVQPDQKSLKVEVVGWTA